jgi:branched-chain amino acid transport system ATP-binding protein
MHDGSGRIVVQNLSKQFGAVNAVQNLSFTVEPGSVTGFLGPNGAGKTTTLRTISGLMRPESGTITFGGRRIDRDRPFRIARAGVLHVPEGRGIFRSLSVRHNLEMAAYALEGGTDVVGEAARVFPALRDRLDQQAGLLSGGEQQMLALARAMLSQPRLLMLDEISMGLAPLIVAQLFDAVRGMAQAGTTVLMVEQYVHAALALADYVYVLDKGRIVDLGEPADMKETGMLSSYLGA